MCFFEKDPSPMLSGIKQCNMQDLSELEGLRLDLFFYFLHPCWVIGSQRQSPQLPEVLTTAQIAIGTGMRLVVVDPEHLM